MTQDRREMLKEEEQNRGNVQNKVMDVEKESSGWIKYEFSLAQFTTDD